MATSPPTLPGDLFLSLAELHKIVLRLPKKESPRTRCKLNSLLTSRQEQYGFYTGHSTTLQLIWVLHHLVSEMNCGQHTVMVLLDMEKVFDRVWPHPSLGTVAFASLSKNHFPPPPDPRRSSTEQVPVTMPICDLHGDIPTLRSHLEEWEDNVMLSLYGDDSTYFASSRRTDLAAGKVQQVFDQLLEWLIVLGPPNVKLVLNIEVSKSKLFIISAHTAEIRSPRRLKKKSEVCAYAVVEKSP
ncbi:RNA-directed DNA polymerase from mobile element jockey [Eumeta japonica]|uniref:RNA-directed DNA polymerase from mobile element jockey n=1 Tax=Eumeta variegata TaxID=151549 RepID=A0A4C1ZE58_EUMVA|nr:RNA-directed DNA polymerase from mobile element jockey [Eumeta japonica]